MTLSPYNRAKSNFFKELYLMKEFLLLCVAIEIALILVSCVLAILLYGLTAATVALINRVSLDRIRLKNRKKKPRVEAIRMGSLLQNDDDENRDR